MSLNTGLKSFHLMQQAIAVATVSLFIIFLVNLYSVRMRIIKLKRQGLVSTCSELRK